MHQQEASLTQVVPISSKELGRDNVHKLRGILEREVPEDADTPAHSSHRHEKPPSIVTAVAAAAINYFLMFGLCCAYGMIMFAADHNSQHRALGVKMSLASAFIMGLLLAFFSRIPVAIGGTDLNPVVFLGDFVTSMAEEIASSLGLEYPESSYRRLGDEGGAVERLLGPAGSSGASFCLGAHLESHRAACEEYHEQLRATSIFAVAMSSAVLGLTYFCLGRFRLTRYVNYLPSSITEAFLSCIGYKVFKYALKFCNYDIKLFIPAACIGVPMYFLKAMHIGHPALVMPVCLLVPLGVFYAFLYGTGSDIDEARSDNLMFPEMYDTPFYAIWTDCLGKTDKINIRAWTATFPDLGLMLIVCVLDCVLKISATENKMPVQVAKDYEIMLHGAGNALVVACGSPVGYMQLKFNVINYGVMGNVLDRRAGLLYAALCGASLFGTISHFNYLPRFFLGTMLFFAGAGFVAENLWGSRKYLSFPEWIEILLILAVFIIFGQLLPAVGVGIVLCGISFIMKYARVPAIAGRPLTGKDVTTRERPESVIVQKNLQHIADSWLMVIRLKGYVFFASAHAVTSYVRNRFESEEARDVPSYRRLKFVVFDCEVLDGMDASGAKTVLKLVKDCAERDVKVLWSSMTDDFLRELKTRSIIHSNQDWFVDLNQAVRYVETHVLAYRMAQQETWVQLHKVFARNEELTRRRTSFEPFRHVFLMESSRLGCPWRFCSSLPISKYRTVLWEPGAVGGSLFLIHTGAVALFESIPSGKEGDDEWSPPIAVYQHGWFLNREALLKAPSKHYAIAVEDGEVISWTQDQWWEMTCERPLMMLELLKAAMKQQGRDNERESKSADHLPCDMADEEWLDFEEETEDHGDLKSNLLVRATTFAFATKAVGRSASRKSGASRSSRSGWRPAASKSGAASASRSGTTSTGSFRLAGAAAGRTQSETCLGAKLGGSVSGVPSRAVGNLPEELHVRLRQLHFAQALGAIKLYEPVPSDEEPFLPELPALCRQDLEVAFNTFSVPCQGAKVIEPGQAVNALMYAGFFNRAAEEPSQPLGRAGFLQFGHRALLAELGRGQRAAIEAGFAKHVEASSGVVKSRDLAALFKSFLKVDICMHEVDSLSRMWLADPGGQLDVNVFTSIVSWLLRKHEHDWQLMRGFRAVMDVPPELRVTEAGLTAQLLACSAGISVSKAQEMLWSADWLHNGQGDGLMIDFGGFMSAILINFSKKQGRLPPPPRLTEDDAEGPSVRTEADLGIMSFQLSDRQATDCGQEVELAACDSQVFRRHCTKAWDAASGKEDSLESEAEPSRSQSCRARVHELMDDPSSSPQAAALSAFLSGMIVLSVFHMVLEPLISGPEELEHSRQERDVWFGMEVFFTALFALEFLVRLLVVDSLRCGPLLGFLMKPRNVCDFVAIVPLFVETALKQGGTFEALQLLRIVRLARLSRLARIARLSRRFPVAAPISVVLVVIWGIYLLHSV